MAKVVNLRTEAYDVYIGRAGKGYDGYFGNPIQLYGYDTAERIYVLEQYAEYFNERVTTDVEFANRVLSLRGKTLGCFCKPLSCHGDVIAAWVDAAMCARCGDQAEVSVNYLSGLILLCQQCAKKGVTPNG